MWLEIVILAIVQGLTEFLPISSSGHLVVGQALFERFGSPMPDRLQVNVVLHMGTLAAILIFYQRRIRELFSRDRRVIGLLAAGSLPAAVAGLVIEKTALGDMAKLALENALLAGFMFPVTGAMLLWTMRRKTGETTCSELGYGRALIIGLFQALAILPGISRSGATIVAGLGVGLRRDEAATFSFLLAIPVIGGAGVLQIVDLMRDGAGGVGFGPLALGTAVSFAVGLAALWWLVKWVQQGRLHLFAWWVIPLGVAVIVWQLVG